MRMGDKVAENITAVQTAYLKERIINDNIRLILMSLKTGNLYDVVDGLLVSLDVRKAFYFVEHSYIENCLVKFGLENIIPIFKILYNKL